MPHPAPVPVRAGPAPKGRLAGRWIDALWYGHHPLARALAPLGWIYCGGAAVRRRLYTSGARPQARLPVPVVVVGNLTVGGTGKTPLVAWIARFLRERGWRPAVIARGYRGAARRWPQPVGPGSDPRLVGDEPVLLARQLGGTVVAGPDRPAAARMALARGTCDVILSDDGLQALALARDVEVAVLDGERRLGNGRCLPAGPLRERPGRLATVDLVVTRGEAGPGELAMHYRPGNPRNLADDQREVPIASLADRPLHAVAGIGNPQAFFGQLRALGLSPIEHPFPDHHRFSAKDLAFADDLPVLMTEKDAVKCRGLAQGDAWYLPIEAVPEPAFGERLLALLSRGARDG